MSDESRDRFMRSIGKVYAWRKAGEWLATLPIGAVAVNIKDSIEEVEAEWRKNQPRSQQRASRPRPTSRQRPTR